MEDMPFCAVHWGCPEGKVIRKDAFGAEGDFFSTLRSFKSRAASIVLCRADSSKSLVKQPWWHISAPPWDPSHKRLEYMENMTLDVDDWVPLTKRTLADLCEDPIVPKWLKILSF